MSLTKTNKEKPHSGAPRLAPRPTAASMARAARNAANRNLAETSTRQSPSRNSHSPVSPKGRETLHKNVAPGNAYIIDSKTAFKPSEPECNIPDFENETVIISDDGTNQYMENDKIKPESDNLDPAEESQSAPPAVGSRPPTPKPGKPSRIPSRPSTPAQHAPRASRPVTPLAKTQSSRAPTPALEKTARADSPSKNEDIKSAYDSKKSQFLRLKKELDLKQQTILEVYECLKGLGEHMVHEGNDKSGEDVQHKDLVLFNVGDWTSEEVAQLCRDAAVATNVECAEEIISCVPMMDEPTVADVNRKLLDVPDRFATLCLRALAERQELIDWVKELVQKSQEDGAGETVDRIADFNQKGLELCEGLRNVKEFTDETVDTASQLSRQVFKEKMALHIVAESLVREVAKLKEDLKQQAQHNVGEVRTESELEKLLEETRRELKEERAAKLAVKDKVLTTESQLKQARGRINKMDRQLRESEASIASLAGTVKSLEDQNRQREVQLEARARKLRESLKTGEMTSTQLAQQRDLLQAEVQDFKDQIVNMADKHKEDIKQINVQMKELKAKLEEEKRNTEKEIELRRQVEEALTESQQNIEDLKAQITHLEKCMPNPDLPTEREMDLWAELQATKETLRNTEDEVTACKREKIRFLETLTKIAESENKVGMQQKLAAELLSKEELVAKMQCQIRELTKNIKLNEQKVVQYEQYVRDLRHHSQALINGEDPAQTVNFEEIQQEMMNLRMGLLESEHRNEELNEALMQREQQLVQQDKTSRAQARVIKVREELINLLKNKETEQSRELSALQHDLEHRMKIVDEVNHQIAAKADEIQDLFSTLESKQHQIHRLEKIVLALEEQQRRAQAQRTRQEEKIAALEHELATGAPRRDKKFLFF